MKKIVLFLLVFSIIGCSKKYYAKESWKAKSNTKELRIKQPKIKHVTKAENWYS